MSTWLESINVTELSATARPANRKRKLFQKAAWSTAFVNDLPDSAFLYVADGGEKDGDGKTVPRSLRYFPVRDGAGNVDLPHVRNALARIPQANLPAQVKDAAAAKARRLLDAQTKSSEEHPMWIEHDNLDEYFEKAAMPDLQKQAIKAAIAALQQAKADMDPAMFKAARGALAKLMGFGVKPKEMAEEKAKSEAVQKSADEAKANMEAVVKSALDKLQAESPAINEAVSGLAELVGVTPTFKRLEQLPDDLKAEWEAMQKSQQDAQAQLVELQKSMAAQKAEAERQEYVTKAQGLTSVPVGAERLGNLLHLVAKSEDADAVKTLDELLKSVDEITAQSNLFRDVGGSGSMPADKGGVFGKIDALAESMIEKSAGPMTIEQARTRVLEQHPELFDRYNAQ